jgi:hypothetical protein
MSELGKVLIDRDLLEDAFDRLTDIKDEGPEDEGWWSDEQKVLFAGIADVLGGWRKELFGTKDVNKGTDQ